jgi:hypothetical protein
MANQTGVNLTQAFFDNMEKKSFRDADRHKNNPSCSIDLRLLR